MPVPSRPPRRPEPPGRAAMLTGGDRLVRALQTSLVTVRFRTDPRFCTEALESGSAEGVGLLVDAKRGIVLTDRHSAPQSLGAIEVTLAGCATVDAEVFFIHPQHNIALLRCDPIAVEMLIKGKLPLKSARFAKGKKACLRPGESVHFVGFDSQGNTFSDQCKVSAVYLPSGKDEFPPWTVPRFRERNLEIVVLTDTPEDARGGVLCDSRGEVRAIFASFDFQSARREETTENFGIPANVFLPLLEAIKTSPDQQPEVRSLDVEVSAVDLATLARGASKLPKPWVEAVRKRCGQQGQVARAICACRVLSTGVSHGLLQPGDVLLSIAGRTITQALDVEEALRPKKERKPSKGKRKRQEDIPICFLRDGKEAVVSVSPTILRSEDDTDLVIWAGLVLRRTPRCILERCGTSVAPRAGGVFVQSVLAGSPAESRELHPHCFLMEMDGQPIRELSDVLHRDQIDRKQNRHAGWVRLLLLDMNGQEHVKAIQRDTLFFPTFMLHRSAERWHCTQKS
ncbi:NMA111 [Symbiodinium pilosum]|uniref:NMA111 protein n=1 Tax=Symbiodinium pilosum TaxID=2952 RepID=A0A812T000_SYMPI|nr:NMA111 [Symbiodinium pilosum]